MKTNVLGKVVLMVDDQSDFFEIYSWQLANYPELKFLHAQSGREAYEIMSKENIDVVISDIDMPNGNGLWLLEKLSAEYAQIPVIIASSTLMHEQELIQRGAAAFVPKTNIMSLESVFRKFA